MATEAQKRGVLVTPSSRFSVGARPEPALRLVFAVEPEERLVEGVRRLAKAVEHVLSERTGPRPKAAEPAELI